MSNPYYTNEILFIPRTIIRSDDGNAQFNAIEQAFDDVHDAVLLKTGGSISGNLAVGGTLGVTAVATFTAKPILSSLTASRPVFSDGSKGLVSVDVTGTGDVVLANAPTLVNPTYTGTLTGGAGVINIGSGQLVKDAAGNFGLGVTPSAWRAQDRAFQIRQTVLHDVNNTGSVFSQNNYLDSSSVFRYINSDFASQYIQNAGASGTHAWFTAPIGTAGAPITFTQVMTLSPSSKLVLNRPTGGAASLEVTGTDGGAQPFIQLQAGTAFRLQSIIGGGITFNQVDVGEAARITSARYFKASNTGSYVDPAGAFHEFSSNASLAALVARNTNAVADAFATSLPSGASGFHTVSQTNGATVYQVLANGNVQNTNNSYGAISDLKLKNIIGEKGSTWEKTKAYRWVEYALKSDPDGKKLLGLIAQEAQQISPTVVTSTPDLREVTKTRVVNGEIEEYTESEPTGEHTLAVGYSVITMQYHRTTQECQHRIEALEGARVQADEFIQQLMNRVDALESVI